MLRPNVMIVEDSHMVVQVIEDLLNKHGYPSARSFDSAEESVAAVKESRPDIVLMDIELRGTMNGFEAARIITSEYSIPVIFLTSAVDVDMLDGAIKSDCSTYLTKPVNEVELIINIEIALQRNRILQLAENERRWRNAILDGIVDAVIAEDESGNLSYMNVPAISLLESGDDYQGNTLETYVTFFDMEGNPLPDVRSIDQQLECQIRTQSGLFHVILMKTQVLPDPNNNATVKVITLDNITDKWIMQEKIRYMTFHDNLTGLYNRNFLEEELIRLNTERQLPVSIIMADLNGLKTINDILGHVDGDLLLKAFAHQLKETCREEDIIARFGGDEFLVFLPATSETSVLHIIQRIRQGCTRTITPLGPMSVALGHYTKVSFEETMEAAIMRADESMYRDKEQQKKDYEQKCFNYVYSELQKHPYEGRSFTDHVVELMENLILLRDDIHEDLRDVRHLGQIYDIGMICLPSNIYKYARFKDGDWDRIQRHSEMSYKIVNMNPQYTHVAEAVLYHHERWDGKGYPYRLKGDSIPVLARLLAVVDSYCTITRPRPYREPLIRQDALIEIAKGAGSQFDPDVVDLFITMMTGLRQ